MDEFEKKIEEALNLVESRTPKVGIYWVDGDEIISFVDDARTVKAVHGFIDSDKNHYDCWRKLRRRGDYTSLPRGRVNYDLRRKKFMVFAPSTLLKDKTMMARIVREFSLPTSKVVFATDTHYENESDLDFDALFDDDD